MENESAIMVNIKRLWLRVLLTNIFDIASDWQAAENRKACFKKIID